MTLESQAQALIDAFFAALVHRDLEECTGLQERVCALAADQPVYRYWCAYLSGILANERDHDWAKAERIFTKLDREQLERPLRSRVLLALGRTYDYQGLWQLAIHFYERSLSIFAELEQPIDQAKVWKQIAIAYRNGFARGDFGPEALDRAIENCQKALQTIDAIADASPDVLWLEGSIENTLGAIYMNLSRWDDSIACYQRDLAICRSLDDRFGAGLSLHNLGEVFQRRGSASWAEALHSYHQALEIVREFDDQYEQADVLANLAALHQEMGATVIALDYYAQAIAVIEGLRIGVSAEEARAGFFATVADTYANAALLCVQAGQLAQAFEYVEQARSRAFLDTLAARSPELTERLDAPTLTLAATQAALPPDALLLEYFTSGLVEARESRAAPGVQRHRFPPEKTLLFAISRTAAQVFDLAISPNALRPSRLNSAVEQHFLKPTFRRTLYERLLAPAEALLRDRPRVYIAPHGPLHYIPFQALLAPDGEPLLREDGPQLVYGPSATVLFRSHQAGSERAAQPCLALGYNGTAQNLLRFAEEEARGVARLAGGHALIGPDPKKEALFGSAADYRLLHLSCHGSFDSEQPLQSALQLAFGEELTAAEVIERLRLRCDLVTLSACQSGLSRVRRGDELVGLLRAFMHAGAPALIATLWRVDEFSTRLLMDHFYHEAQAGAGFAEALKRAQLYLKGLTRRQAFDALVRLLAEDILTTSASPSQGPTELPEQALEVGRSYLKGLAADRGAAPSPEQPDDHIFDDAFFWAPFILVGDHGSD